MTNEQLLEQFEELAEKYRDLDDRQLNRSAMKVAVEAKRFAKSHRLLMPYLHACFSITNYAQDLFEPEIGADNAMEIIALVESEEKARKFQHDYDEDHYRYTVHQISACAYDNLAEHTAMRNGHNSPVVHGAVDDGIHICRRTGKLECVDCFREYASDICLASADYEMGEHHARLCALATVLRNDHDRRYIGYKNLALIYRFQGKLVAAFEAVRGAVPMVETYHDPFGVRIELAHQAELLCLLTERESELPELLRFIGFPNVMPDIPPREENAQHHFERTVNEALRQTIRGEFAKADSILAEEERFLLGQETLNRWFPIRVQRIASRLLETETADADTERLADELRRRASKACQWSAIQSLDAMLQRTVRLNPLGIAFPLDIGPYATEGTPISRAQIQHVLPLIEKVIETPKIEEKEKSPRELEIASWFAALQPLWEAAEAHEETQPDTPFPQADELAKAEQELYDKILRLTPDELTEEECMEASRSLIPLRLLNDPAKIDEAWKWMKRMVAYYPDRGRPLAGLAYHGFINRKRAVAANFDPAALGLPEPAELEQWIADAFEKEPNRVGIATTAGMIFRAHGNNREAQRYFSRANQIDRLNEFAAFSLTELYEEAERPKDALATIELYTRAGGRHPGLLWQATQIAFRNGMPLEFLSYYSAYTALQPSYPMLDAQHVAALCQTAQWSEAIKGLDVLDEILKTPGRDRLFVRALCQAELGDDTWLTTFDTALSHPEGDAEGLSAFDPSESLWQRLRDRNDSDERREAFEQFLFERGLVPDDFFAPSDENESEELSLRNFYHCTLKQPLNTEIAAYAGWMRIPAEDTVYFALWFVLADSPKEATELALEFQGRCYPLRAESVECAQLDSYHSRRSRVVAQGKRFPPPDEVTKE